MSAFLRSFPKAVIFDVYQTILEVGAAPEDADVRWEKLWGASGATQECPTLDTFSECCQEMVTEEHTSARSGGIAWPEVVWPEIILRAVPSLREMTKPARDQWIYDHQSCLRTVRLAPGAETVLAALHEAGALLGIVSNAQAYTLRELQAALAGSSVDFGWFDPRLCVWSYACGFSKPDPYFFRILSARLVHRGLAPQEILMVGDRMDNDILPARGIGWQTWQLSDRAELKDGGNWDALAKALESLKK